MADGQAADYLLCSAHGSPVTMSDGVVAHWDGGYCSSKRFTTEALDREQAIILLKVALGRSGLAPGS